MSLSIRSLSLSQLYQVVSPSRTFLPQLPPRSTFDLPVNKTHEMGRKSYNKKNVRNEKYMYCRPHLLMEGRKIMNQTLSNRSLPFTASPKRLTQIYIRNRVIYGSGRLKRRECQCGRRTNFSALCPHYEARGGWRLITELALLIRFALCHVHPCCHLQWGFQGKG